MHTQTYTNKVIKNFGNKWMLPNSKTIKGGSSRKVL